MTINPLLRQRTIGVVKRVFNECLFMKFTWKALLYNFTQYILLELCKLYIIHCYTFHLIITISITIYQTIKFYENILYFLILYFILCSIDPNNMYRGSIFISAKNCIKKNVSYPCLNIP